MKTVCRKHYASYDVEVGCQDCKAMDAERMAKAVPVAQPLGHDANGAPINECDEPFSLYDPGALSWSAGAWMRAQNTDPLAELKSAAEKLVRMKAEWEPLTEWLKRHGCKIGADGYVSVPLPKLVKSSNEPGVYALTYPAKPVGIYEPLTVTTDEQARELLGWSWDFGAERVGRMGIAIPVMGEQTWVDE